MVQNRKRIHTALKRADIVLTIIATWLTSFANCVNRFAVIMKTGVPGGCPTSSLNAEEMNSGQSQ